MTRLNVSRETMERLELYLSLLKKWNPAINLVSKSTIKNAWDRHFADSIQLYSLAPKGWQHWVDMGSGGGFPGAVIAIIARDIAPDVQITLIESDQRKAAFLRNVLRETESTGQVLANRIEAVDPLQADIISARALADLSTLLEYSARHGREGATFLFPKGVRWQKELLRAEESWSFACEPIKSETDPNAIVLKIRGLVRA